MEALALSKVPTLVLKEGTAEIRTQVSVLKQTSVAFLKVVQKCFLCLLDTYTHALETDKKTRFRGQRQTACWDRVSQYSSADHRAGY